MTDEREMGVEEEAEMPGERSRAGGVRGHDSSFGGR
jgi:hypothetical protein